MTIPGGPAGRRRGARRKKAAGSEADGPGREACLVRFPHLDVAILDGVVYTTTRGLTPFGLLAAASAASRRLPSPGRPPGSPARTGSDAAQQTERTAIVITSGASRHGLVIEHLPSAWTSRQIENQVAEFNFLAREARSVPSGDPADGVPGQAGVTIVA